MIRTQFNQVLLNADQYLHDKTVKNQIVIHHTVSSHNPSGVVAWWNSNKERVATPFIIDNKGKVVQCYDDSFWSYHLMVSSHANSVGTQWKRRDKILNQSSLGIENTNAGPVIKQSNGLFKSTFGRLYKPENVIYLPYRDWEYFEKYTEDQILSLQNMIILLAKENSVIAEGIKEQKVFDNIFDINLNALSGKSGLYTHTSYRTDKSDCCPQPILLDMLNGLGNKLV